MKIVTYNLRDSIKVAEFFREIFDEWGWNERPSDHMDEPHKLFQLPNDGLLLIIKEKDLVVGTAGIILLTKTDGLIKRFYIKKQNRGSGVAQLLLTKLINKAKQLGVKKLILDVSKNNARAVRFYEKSGFLPTSVSPQEGWPESYDPEGHFYFYKLISQ